MLSSEACPLHWNSMIAAMGPNTLPSIPEGQRGERAVKVKENNGNTVKDLMTLLSPPQQLSTDGYG